MNTIKRIIFSILIFYILIILYVLINSYVSWTEIIKASIIGFVLATINIMYDVFFRKDLKQRLHKVKKHIKNIRVYK